MKLRVCTISNKVSGAKKKRVNKIREMSMPVCQSEETRGLLLGFRCAMQI
jgi:hypothetical protein